MIYQRFFESKNVTFLLLTLLVFFTIWSYYPSLSGDSSIYFSYFKNFFRLPFSFRSNEVCFGASSPLFVLIMSTFFSLGDNYWLITCKIVSFTLYFSSIYPLTKSINTNRNESILITLVFVLNYPMLIATSSLFETGLMSFTLSFMIYLEARKEETTLMIILGILNLIRPELLLFSLISQFLIVTKRKDKKIMIYFILSYLPTAIYYLYMYHHTGTYIPTSVIGRAITSLEYNYTWFESFTMSILAILKRPENIIYYLIIFTVILTLAKRELRKKHKKELWLLLGLIFPFILSPPSNLAPRYYLSTTIQFIPLLVCIFRTFTITKGTFILFTLFMMTIFTSLYGYNQSRKYDLDVLLLKDLSDSLETHGISQDKRVLIYEIQAQYFVEHKLISADGIVGNEIHKFLFKKESFFESIKKNRINYIVTSNSFNYRPIYKNSPLQDLYLHDLSSVEGESISIGGYTFTKIFSNIIFKDPTFHSTIHFPQLNKGDSLRVYHNKSSNFRNHHPFWNSVYKVN